ncbi:MAG: hypothetical protein QM621_09650 [Aeromicrobium sp.]|uniref:hypothetical protein n=1 Tax=Aeromicrobium sp. TaxID=1871063 RepID=UPI0039E6AA0F
MESRSRVLRLLRQRWFQLTLLLMVVTMVHYWFLSALLPLAVNFTITVLSMIALVLLLREAFRYDGWVDGGEDESLR